ncbi:MAG: DUF4136 domain-containing protein [Sphingomonas sp.]
MKAGIGPGFGQGFGPKFGIVATAAALALAGCATAPMSAPVEVSRFHLDPVDRGTITSEAASSGWATSLESQIYTGAVQNELLRYGYTAATPGMPSQYSAMISVARTSQEGAPRRSPLTIGIGGGGYSGGYRGGVGLGGGVSFPVGKTRYRQILMTTMSVQIRRRSDGTVIWEGHAQTAADSGSPDAQANAEATKLASAILRGFPGESGRTITVK